MHRRAAPQQWNFDISKVDGPKPVVPTAVPAKPDQPKSDEFTGREWCMVAMVAIVILGFTGLLLWINVFDSASVGGSVPFTELAASSTPCPAAVSQALPAGLDAMRTTIRTHATSKAPISWSEYAADPATNAGRHVILVQNDFSDGTVRIQSSGLFVLEEDIEFAPNADFDFFPRLPAQSDLYGGNAYELGFFAAITIEAAGVVVDLNGHELRQSDVFAVEQRFFAGIELADQPFLGGQGPAMFGTEIVVANGLVIENGIIGRSSHHGIHGNGGQNVLIQDVTFRNYEVAAIALNGFRDTLIRRVVAEGQFTEIPVLGTYSNARFLKLAVQKILAADIVLPLYVAEIELALADLQTLMDHVRQDVDAVGRIRQHLHGEAYALFDNELGLSDGSSYGILFYPIGVAVNAFWHKQTPAPGAPGCVERILLQDVIVNNTKINVIEVVALVAPNGAPVRGPFGDVLRITDNIGKIQLFDDAIGTYNGGNALSRLQTAIMAAALSVTDAAERKRVFGTTNADANTVSWLRGGLSLADLITQHNHTYQRNGDVMFHVNKGVVGLRLDAVRDGCLANVSVLNTENVGKPGVTHALPGEQVDEGAYTGQSDGGHPLQGLQYGYMGADARGVSMAATNNMCLSGLVVDGVHSFVGDARAIDLFNFANFTFSGHGCAVRNVSTLVDDAFTVSMGHAMMGPKIGSAIGIRSTSTSAASVYGLTNVSISNVVSRVFEQASFLVIDASPEHKSVPVVEDQAVNSYGL